MTSVTHATLVRRDRRAGTRTVSRVAELHDLTGLEQGAAIAAGETSTAELVEHYLARIEAHTDLGAFVTVTHTVGVIASQPKFFAGSLDPRACEKAVKLLCLTDAYDIPVLFFQDVPGFFVGKQVEHDGMLKHAIRLQTALALHEAPKLTTVLRKAYGLAYFSLGGNDSGVDTVYAWPSAEISFMDPLVAANVVAGGDDTAREAAMDYMSADIDPYGAAGLMKVDEIIDPADTRPTLSRALNRLSNRPPADGSTRPLAAWPTC